MGDCSNGDHNRVLNAPVVRDLVAKRFGPLTHPTISDVIEAVFHLAERHGGLSHIRLWKEELLVPLANSITAQLRRTISPLKLTRS